MSDPEWSQPPKRTLAGGAPSPQFLETAPRPGVYYGAWTWWQRFGFRFAALYVLLYAFPLPISAGLTSLATVLRQVAAQMLGEGSALAERLTTTAAWLANATATAHHGIDSLWQAATTRVGDLSFVELHVVHQATGSGDTLHDCLRVLVAAGLALAGCLLWSLLSRASCYPRLGRFVHLLTRFYVGYWLLVHGAAKLYSGEFVAPSIARLTQDLGDMSPMRAMWSFFGASRGYELVIGAFEVVAALLLLHRNTAMLGALLAFPVLANIAVLTWCYDVPLRLFSTHLCVFAFALLVPWFGAFSALLRQRTARPVDLRVVRASWLHWQFVFFGSLWLLLVLGALHFDCSNARSDRIAQRSEPAHFGRWDVTRMVVDGEELAPKHPERWQYVALDVGQSAFFAMADGSRTVVHSVESAGSDSLLQWFESSVDASASEPVGEFRTESTEVLATAPHPDPKTPEQVREVVEQSRRGLVLEGNYRGRAVRIETVEHEFALKRPFRFVQEVPVNR